MADNLLRLRVDSTEYDSKLKKASEGLWRYAENCRKAGGTLETLDDGVMDFVKALGNMETESRTASGSLKELQKAFADMKMQYDRMTEAEKNSEMGKAWAASLDQLKTRAKEAQKSMQDINQTLHGGKFGQFGGIIDNIGKKMGVTGNLTEILTSKTAMMYAGIGAGIAVIGKATDAWVKYNSEIAKQDNITTVTTGLKGPSADRMTDSMRAVSDTYKVDFRDAINAANVLMTQFGKTGDEAIQLIKDGMQGMILGDGPKLLSMIQQFAPAFRDAGISADKLIAIIHNSEGGLFSEQNMNAILMGIKNIRLMTKATSDALAQMGIDGQEMSRKMSDGSMTVFEALKQVAYAIENAKSGSKEAGQVMQAVFGRQGAMQGMKLGRAIAELNTNLEETKKKTGELGDAYAELMTANENLNTAIRDCFEYNGWEEMATGIKAKLVSALTDVLNVLNGIQVTWGNIKNIMSPDSAANGAGAMLGGLVGKLPEKVRKPAQQVQELRTSTDKKATYDKQVAQYDARIEETKKKVQMLAPVPGQPDTPAFREMWEQEKKVLKNLEEMKAAYTTQAKAVLEEKPEKNTNTNNNNTNNNNTTGSKSDKQTAKDKFSQAEKDYQQSLEQIALELEGKRIDTVEAKKKELQAEESLWKSIGDAREIYDSEELQKAQAEAAQRFKELGGSVKQLEEQQKQQKDAARELANAQKKAAEYYRKAQEALGKNDMKGYGTARKQYEAQQQEVKRLQQAMPQAQTQNQTTTKTTNIQTRYSVDADTGKSIDKLRKIGGVRLDDKTMTVTFDDKKAMDEAKKLQGFKFTPKTFSIDADTGKSIDKVRKVNGQKVDDKRFSVDADTGKSIDKLRKIRGVHLDDKTMTVTFDDKKAMDEAKKLQGFKFTPKEFEVTMDDTDVLKGLKEIDGVRLDEKTMTVTFDTDEAMQKAEQLQGFKFTPIRMSVGAVGDIPQIEGQQATYTLNVDSSQLTQLQELLSGVEEIQVNVEQGKVDLPEMPEDTYTVTIQADTAQAQQKIDAAIVGWEAQKVTLPVELDLPELPEVPVGVNLTTNNLDFFKNQLKEKLANTDVETTDFANIQAQFADVNALSNIMQKALGAGMDISQLGLGDIFGEVFKQDPGDYLRDDTLQAIIDKMNEYFKEHKLEPIEIDFNTGNVKGQAKGMTKDWKDAANAISQVGSAMQSIEDPAVKVVGTVAQAIASIALGFAQASASPATTAQGVWGWIAAAIAGTATMISTIAAIHSATGYAEGGVIKGNTYSNDQIGGLVDGTQFVGLNAGEVVLNKAQTNALASFITSAERGGGNASKPYVTGQTIVLGINNWAKQNGKGQLVFSKG